MFNDQFYCTMCTGKLIMFKEYKESICITLAFLCPEDGKWYMSGRFKNGDPIHGIRVEDVKAVLPYYDTWGKIDDK